MLGKPDNDPSSDWLKWAHKHVDCSFHPGSLTVSEVRFNPGFNGALTNGIKLGSSGGAMLKLYGEPEHGKERPNGARQYEFSTKGILFWTYQGKITQIVVFKPYSLDNSTGSSCREKKVTEARSRMGRDKGLFSQQDLDKMESLTRIADEHFGTDEARKAMKTLVDKYRTRTAPGALWYTSAK